MDLVFIAKSQILEILRSDYMRRFCKEISEYLKEYSMDHEDPVYISNSDRVVIVSSPSWKSWNGKFDTYNYFKVIVFDKYKSYTEYLNIKDRMNVDIKIYRINLRKPEYIEDKTSYGYLSKEELKSLIKVLNSNAPEYIRRGNSITVWETIIANLNWEHSDDYRIYGIHWNNIPEDLPMPDYSLLPTID
jgi:hypothetical protein